MPQTTPPDSGVLRAGFLGAGFMATVHTRASRAARARLVALATSSATKAAAAAIELGVERAEAESLALISSPDIDVVHICTPNTSHAEYAAAALAAGKHVICEKPLATTVADARLLADAARDSDAVAAVSFVYRYHPMVREARSRIAKTEIGELLTLDCSYLQDWLLAATDSDWRTSAATGGSSRAFADIGSHLCDLIEFVTGERIARLVARTRTVHTSRAGASVENEDIAALLVEFDGGALGTLLISQMAPGRKNALTLELHGTEQSLRFEQERPEVLWVGTRRNSQLVQRDVDVDVTPGASALSLVPSGHPMGYQDAFNAFIADAYAVARGEVRDALPNFEDGLRAAVLTEAVLESARSGQWIDVPVSRQSADVPR